MVSVVCLVKEENAVSVVRMVLLVSVERRENAVCLVSAVRMVQREKEENAVRKEIRGNVVSVGRRVVMVWQRRLICFWVVILRVLLGIVKCL